MAKKICAQVITDTTQTDTFDVTCNPPQTVVGLGSPAECLIGVWNSPGPTFTASPIPTISYTYDAQLKYTYLEHGMTKEAFCNVTGVHKSLTFDADVSTCDCGSAFSMSYSATCDPTAMSFTPTSVTGPFTVSFTLNNLCSNTIICVEESTGC